MNSFPMERSDSPAANRNRSYEHEVITANRRLDHLIQEHRQTFGPNSIRGPEISDWRKCLWELHGLDGLKRGIEAFEGALRRGQPLAMDFWGEDEE